MNGLLTAEPRKPYSIGLSLTPKAGYVHLAGELDIQASASLTRLFVSLEVVTSPIHVDMEGVTFIDSMGATPLVEGDRRRRSLGLPAVRIDTCSATVGRFFAATGIGGQPYFELETWDRLRAASEANARRLISRIASFT
jgi:anti-anti-sigma factor